jgi:hypothetical protein
MSDWMRFHKCAAASCECLVSSASLFCCAPCADADHWRHEIHAHSDGCTERQAVRAKKGRT